MLWPWSVHMSCTNLNHRHMGEGVMLWSLWTSTGISKFHVTAVSICVLLMGPWTCKCYLVLCTCLYFSFPCLRPGKRGCNCLHRFRSVLPISLQTSRWAFVGSFWISSSATNIWPTTSSYCISRHSKTPWCLGNVQSFSALRNIWNAAQTSQRWPISSPTTARSCWNNYWQNTCTFWWPASSNRSSNTTYSSYKRRA
jgi:hypothetical protein